MAKIKIYKIRSTCKNPGGQNDNLANVQLSRLSIQYSNVLDKLNQQHRKKTNWVVFLSIKNVDK